MTARDVEHLVRGLTDCGEFKRKQWRELADDEDGMAQVLHPSFESGVSVDEVRRLTAKLDGLAEDVGKVHSKIGAVLLILSLVALALGAVVLVRLL